jgi:hypothetical protein
MATDPDWLMVLVVILAKSPSERVVADAVTTDSDKIADATAPTTTLCDFMRHLSPIHDKCRTCEWSWSISVTDLEATALPLMKNIFVTVVSKDTRHYRFGISVMR